MELPDEISEQLSSAEEDIKRCQDLIDLARSQNPTDNGFQFKMDLNQSALDERKKRVRILKTVISKITE